MSYTLHKETFAYLQMPNENELDTDRTDCLDCLNLPEIFIQTVLACKGFKLFYSGKALKSFFDFLDFFKIPAINNPKRRFQNLLAKEATDLDKQILAIKQDFYYCKLDFFSVTDVSSTAFLAKIVENSILSENYNPIFFCFDSLTSFDWTKRGDFEGLFLFRDAPFEQPSDLIRLLLVNTSQKIEQWLDANATLDKFSLNLKTRFKKTSHILQGKPIFEEIATKRFWYLDNFHKNEYEIFDAQGKHIGVADLDGTLDVSKKVDGRTIDI